MGRQCDWDSVKETSTRLDEGVYLVQSISAEEVLTKPSETSEGGKLMYVHMMQVMEPHEFVGQLQRDNWTIGSEADRNADDPETWKASIGAKQMKRCLSAAHVPLTREIDACLATLVGQQFLISIKHTVDKKNTQFTNANISNYWAVGARAIGLAASNGALAPTRVALEKAADAAFGMPKVAVKIAPPAAPGNAKVVKPPKDEMQACPACEWKGPKREYPLHAQVHDDEDE